jgi:phosphoribosyl 1,2-cyclic phosphodiesterase
MWASRCRDGPRCAGLVPELGGPAAGSAIVAGRAAAARTLLGTRIGEEGDLRLHLCGVRGSTPAPGPEFVRYGGHTSCVALAHDDEDPTLLLDAGTGIRRVWHVLGQRPFRGSILLGHLHWDHTHGLPFFAAGDHPDASVDLYLPEQDGDPEEVLARAMSPPHFPIRPSQLRGRWRFHHLAEGEHEVEGFAVLAREIPHKGGRTFGYRVSDGRATIAYLSDHHPYGLGAGPDGIGVLHDAARELADGVDLLLHDAQYTAEEFAERAEFGHSVVEYPVALAEACGVRHLVLFHHDPAHTDVEVDAILARLAGASVPISAAAEEEVIWLPEPARVAGRATHPS